MNEIEIEFVGSEEHIEVDPLVDDAVFPHNSYSSSPSFPTNANFPPILETGIATLAGAPPGTLRKPGASARDTPDTVVTKSMSISPNETIKPAPVFSTTPLEAIAKRFFRERKWRKNIQTEWFFLNDSSKIKLGNPNSNEPNRITSASTNNWVLFS